MANSLDVGSFAPTAPDTRTIIKASLINKDNKSDKIRLHNYSYTTLNRVDYIPRLGRDGRMHTVPVPWVEYVPVYNEAILSMKNLGIEENKFKGFSNTTEFNDVGINGSYSYKKGLLACLVNDDQTAFDEKIDKIFKQ